MARISRKGQKLLEEFQPGEYRIYHVAQYVRLSKEDNGKDDSDSIENQIGLIQKYIQEKPYLFPVGLYVDNGYTGTDFDRPEFNRMMDDIRAGIVDCIIIKDLSRLGRNYVEAGEFIDKVCPFMGIRLISINDGFDTAEKSNNSELGISLKNLINDIYAKDISRKASSALKAKRLRGEYIGNYAPYGYLKSPEDKNKLIIDPETAPIVVKIFELRASGMGFERIADYLNTAGYPSPGRLRFQRGIITNNNKQGENLLWKRHVLSDLLKNIVYIGHLAQGRSSSSLYQGIPFHWVKEENWDIVENTHEPIISYDLWKQVQTINTEHKQKAKECSGKYSKFPPAKSLYGKRLVCADCGRPMKMVRSIAKGGTRAYYNYKCPSNMEHGDAFCPKKNIRASDLDQIVLEVLQKQMSVFLDMQEVFTKLIKAAAEKNKLSGAAAKIRELNQEYKRKKKLCTNLYTDMKEGILSKDEYIYAKKKYQADLEFLKQEIAELESQHEQSANHAIQERKWNHLANAYLHAKVLTAEMVEAMVDKIIIRKDGSVDVILQYMNEFEELIAECKKLKKESA